MRKPAFKVTAGAIITLTLIGVFRVIYEPLLPPSPTEYILTLPASEHLAAPIVEINWKQTIEEAQVDAKRRKLGILIFFVDPSDMYAKKIELSVFRDPEVCRVVNRNFVAVKINLDKYPEWFQAISPIQRLGRYLDPGADLVVTTQDGTLIDHLGIESPFQYLGHESILPFLIKCQRLVTQPNLATPGEDLESLQAKEIESLSLAPAEPVPSIDEYIVALKKDVLSDTERVFKGGSTKFRPMAFRVLAKNGQDEIAANRVRELLLSPLYDPLDGGFFREARSAAGITIIDTSKSAPANALSSVVIAQLACARRDPQLKGVALDIGNEVMTEFSDGDSFCAARLNDQTEDMRSRRSSLTIQRLASILTSAETRTFLSFVTKDKSDGQDLVTLTGLDVLRNPEFLRLRSKIKENLGYTPGLSEPDQIAVDGYVAARLFDLYRYTDDVRFLNRAKQISEQVYAALSEDSVARVYGNRQLGPGWLGTYLAVADCGLSDYAATGTIYPLRNGEKALKLAIKMFKDPKSGLLVNVPADPLATFRFTPSIPDLADRGREGLNSQAIRLAYHYSTVAEDPASQAEIAAFAQGVTVRLNWIMKKADSSAAGYYDAAIDAFRGQAMIVSGPNRLELSIRLARKYPFLVVYPASVPDGKPKTAVYLRHGYKMDGPFDESEIEKKLKGASR